MDYRGRGRSGGRAPKSRGRIRNRGPSGGGTVRKKSPQHGQRPSPPTGAVASARSQWPRASHCGLIHCTVKPGKYCIAFPSAAGPLNRCAEPAQTPEFPWVGQRMLSRILPRVRCGVKPKGPNIWGLDSVYRIRDQVSQIGPPGYYRVAHSTLFSS